MAKPHHITKHNHNDYLIKTIYLLVSNDVLTTKIQKAKPHHITKHSDKTFGLYRTCYLPNFFKNQKFILTR
jgi:hypothetical protein